MYSLFKLTFEILGNVRNLLFHHYQRFSLYTVTYHLIYPSRTDLNGNNSSSSMLPHLPWRLSEGHVFLSLKAVAHSKLRCSLVHHSCTIVNQFRMCKNSAIFFRDETLIYCNLLAPRILDICFGVSDNKMTTNQLLVRFVFYSPVSSTDHC